MTVNAAELPRPAPRGLWLFGNLTDSHDVYTWGGFGGSVFTATGGAMEQFLAAVKRIIIQGIDWLFWLISTAWNFTFGQISRALSVSFQSLPDWKAVLYIALVGLLLYMAYMAIPRLLGAFMAIIRAIWELVETLMKIVINLAAYIIAAYLAALAINAVNMGAIVGKMPWQ